MADDGSVSTRQRGLQHAASVIFALVAIVPLLIFAWTLNALGVLRNVQAQISLGLALAVALLGFWMFRSLLGRMAEVVQALTAAVEQASRTRRPPMPAPAAVPATPLVHEAVPVMAAAAAAPARVDNVVAPAAAPAGTAMAAVAPRPEAPAVAQPTRAVAGLGKIRELTEVVRTMDALWFREASAYLGQRVQISVANSRDPLVGTLSEATPDGLILEQADGTLPIAYGRVTSIDRLH